MAKCAGRYIFMHRIVRLSMETILHMAQMRAEQPLHITNFVI